MINDSSMNAMTVIDKTYDVWLALVWGYGKHGSEKLVQLRIKTKLANQRKLQRNARCAH